jgi:outer membrane lipoprotein-sorting protein
MLGLSARHARWAAPVVIAAAVAGGAQVAAQASTGRPDLPQLTARDLLVKVQSAKVSALSGTVRSTTDLGFPAVPQQGGLDWSSLLTGTQTLRVYLNGPQHQRVDLIGTLTQASVVHDDSTLWTWNSTTRTVTRTALPASGGGRTPQALPDVPGSPGDLTQRLPLTPQQAAERALAAVSPTTKVSVGRSASVAGRDAYDLRLQPRDAASLVGSVDVYVDARTGLVLRTVVTPRSGGAAAIDIGFTRLSLSAPAASTFRFTPPPGASVRDVALPTRPHDGSGTAQRPSREKPSVQTFGTGWTTVVRAAAPRPSPSAAEGSADPLAGVLLRAARPVPADQLPGGGRLLTTRLVSVLLTTDGHLYVGAVTPDELIRTARTGG